MKILVVHEADCLPANAAKKDDCGLQDILSFSVSCRKTMVWKLSDNGTEKNI
ncbi:MAG: hypothetical protein MJY46_04805 [Bacteroidales bacterium]|nr:hypothetical protein [Bacteroidales bacterium]